MWNAGQSSSFNSNERNISPLLVNFNPFDILEPQRINAIKENNTTQSQTDIKSVKVLDGSFCDVKRDVETIDLLDNFFTTPQEVSNKKIQNENDLIVLEDFLQTQSTSVSTVSDHNKRLDEEFSKFFDKYEANVKDNNIESTKIPSANNSETYLRNKIIESITYYPLLNEPKVLVPKLDLNELKCQKVDDNEEQDAEDLLDEVILSKNLEKLMLSGRYSTDDTIAIENHKALFDDFKLTPNPAITINAATNPKIQVPNNPAKSIYNCIKLLQTIKKDEKLFKKRRIVTNDSEKMGYTKGPDLYEKSVVLPQIMERLKETKKALDDQKSIKKRLVLDAGTSSLNNVGAAKKLTNILNPHRNNKIPMLSNSAKVSTTVSTLQKQEMKAAPTSTSLEVLMENCNRERLLAFERRRMINNFVRTGMFCYPK